MPLTQVQAGMMDSTAQYYSFKNRIINGAMVIDQRNAGAAVTTSGSYGPDRFYFNNVTDGTLSFQQSTDVPSGQGFSYSARITATVGDASIGAAQYANLQTSIEGFNFADMGFGASGASNVTLSFWVKATVVGNYSVALYNSAENRVNPQQFSVSLSNTWEKKTITFAGDTTGTWLTTNGKGANVTFYYALGSNFLGSSGWNTGGIFGVTGQSNALSSNGNIFAITGVQLEKGSTATSFDYRPYGTELALCQRYLPVAIAPPFVVSSYFATGVNAGSISYPLYVFKVTPRVAPTGISVSSPADFGIYNGVASFTASGVTFNSASLDGSLLSVTGATLSNGTAVGMYFTNSNGKILFNGCEL